MEKKQSYIESRLPLEEISIESQRERGTSSALPPPYFLHVWWARRPLVASRAAILGVLLPESTSDRNFKRLLGIKGDPITAQRRRDEAKRIGKRLKSNPFDYERAFTVNLDDSFPKLARIYQEHVGSEIPILVDPMAGGGHIPLEGLRCGLHVIAAEYNPVAYLILRSTLEYPAKYGPSLGDEIRKWGHWVDERARADLEPFFPHGIGESILDYIWVRTVRCSSCNLMVPLAPNWWLLKPKQKKTRIALRPKISPNSDVVTFEILDLTKSMNTSFDPRNGTFKKGKASCLRCKNTLSGDYIKEEAQNGRMQHRLCALYVQLKRNTGNVRTFRLPTANDLEAYEKAVRLVEKGDFQGAELIPKESFPEGSDNRPLWYGMPTWDKFFNARQLLTHATYLHYILQAKDKILNEYGKNNKGRAVAITTYLALIFDKCIDYSSLLSLWNTNYAVVTHTFDRHDFAFTCSYAEMNMIDRVTGGFSWATETVATAYDGLCRLLRGVGPSKVKVFLGSSTDMSYLKESVDVVVVDPPYYGNVMYGELSDFFYVWMKRMLGDLYAGFDTLLTDKDGEVVANPARFKGLGVSAEEKAKEDYRLKMAQTFKQIHRVLKSNGILVIMFTHKATEAWDTLATALVRSGFQIKRSWPIRTEYERGLHIAKKNAVKSTIFLVARKREGEARRGWWEQEIYPEIERVAEEKAAEFETRGMEGVDLYISTFGPVLEVFSKFSEVKSMTGDVISPEKALDVARKVVTDRTFRSLVPSGATGIDETTRFYILAMKFYRARQFPFDEARKLAISVGINTDDLRDKEHVIKKKSEDVVVLNASEREHEGYIDLAKPSDRPLIDAIHLAELAFQHGGLKAYQRLASQIGLDVNPDYHVVLKALYESLPEVDSEKRALASLLLTPVESRVKGSRIDDYS